MLVVWPQISGRDSQPSLQSRPGTHHSIGLRLSVGELLQQAGNQLLSFVHSQRPHAFDFYSPLHLSVSTMRICLALYVTRLLAPWLRLACHCCCVGLGRSAAALAWFVH